MKSPPPTSLTEKVAKLLIGKTFVYYWNGEPALTGIIYNVLNSTQLLLGYDSEAGEEEFVEIRPMSDCGFDYGTKTGFRFSKDNPHYETFAG
jgi:hypothetical protein